MQSMLLKTDAGPEFAGWAGAVDGRMICVAPRDFDESDEAKRSMREIVRRSGGDCEECRGCPLGT